MARHLETLSKARDSAQADIPATHAHLAEKSSLWWWFDVARPQTVSILSPSRRHASKCGTPSIGNPYLSRPQQSIQSLLPYT